MDSPARFARQLFFLFSAALRLCVPISSAQKAENPRLSRRVYVLGAVRKNVRGYRDGVKLIGKNKFEAGNLA
jgi:hypothetical protein